jgi:hypothetical protein
MQHNQIETAINRVGDGIVAVKARQSRLRHDHAIQGGNGVWAAWLAAKMGKNHRVGSGADRGLPPVTSTPSPMQG